MFFARLAEFLMILWLAYLVYKWGIMPMFFPNAPKNALEKKLELLEKKKEGLEALSETVKVTAQLNKIESEIEKYQKKLDELEKNT